MPADPSECADRDVLCARTAQHRGFSVTRLAAIITIVALVLASSPATTHALVDSAAVPHAYASVERVLESDETGVSRPVGIAWDARAQHLVVTDGDRPGRALALSIIGASRGAVTAAAARTLGDAARAASGGLDVASREPTHGPSRWIRRAVIDSRGRPPAGPSGSSTRPARRWRSAISLTRTCTTWPP